MKPLRFFKEINMGIHTIQHHCDFNHPQGYDNLLTSCQVCFFALYHWAKNRFCRHFQIAHPSLIATLANYFRHNFRCTSCPCVCFSKLVSANGPQYFVAAWQWLNDSQHPLWPYVLFRIGSSATKYASFNHWELAYEETKDQEGREHSYPEARRLLQEPEESRHALSDQRQETITAETALSHLRGGCTAMRTRSNNPEGAS